MSLRAIGVALDAGLSMTNILALLSAPSRPIHEVLCRQGKCKIPSRSYLARTPLWVPGHHRCSHSAAPARLEIPDRPGLATGTHEKLRTLLPPSKEQQIAIDTLLNSNNNLIVEACAGSGKTTTILHLAQAAPETKFLVLVYNRRLMLETEERVQALGLRNIIVMNYHTLGARYYTAECATDQGLKRAVQDDMPVMDGMELPEFSVLVMDEQQDMTPILKRFVDKVICDRVFAQLKKRPNGAVDDLRIVVLGDRRQEIYGFNNADSRFLTMASRPEVFGYVNRHGWTTADQTTSNRVPQQVVDFINPQMLKRPSALAMRAVRNQNEQGHAFPKPRYVLCDPYEDLLDEVLRLLDTGNVLPEDIIVLAPSVRGLSPTIYLANSLALRRIPVFRSDSDVSDIAPEVARGKVLICTYHQAKGIERKASIVLGFDQNYHLWYNKLPESPTATSNPQYVAVTRALEHLVLIHDHKAGPLPFVDLKSVGKSCDLVVVRPIEIEEPEPPRVIPRFSVTALCRNLSETLITACLKKLRVHMLAAPAHGVRPPIPTETKDIYGLLENVSAITGTAVPAIFQWHQRKRLTILEGCLKLLKAPKRPMERSDPLRQLPKASYKSLAMIEKAYIDKTLTTNDILLLSNFDMSTKSKDITKLLVIPPEGYSWISEAHRRDIYLTLHTLPAAAKISGRDVHFEQVTYRRFETITHGGGPTNPIKRKGVILSGAMDICRPRRREGTVWELKYTQSLQPEHVLQVALYMLLLGESANGFLVSVRTGQTVQVVPRTADSLLEVLQLLVDAKSGGKQTRLLNTYSDKEFLESCRQNFEDLVDECALPSWFAMKPTGSKYEGSKSKRLGS